MFSAIPYSQLPLWALFVASNLVWFLFPFVLIFCLVVKPSRIASESKRRKYSYFRKFIFVLACLAALAFIGIFLRFGPRLMSV